MTPAEPDQTPPASGSLGRDLRVLVLAWLVTAMATAGVLSVVGGFAVEGAVDGRGWASIAIASLGIAIVSMRVRFAMMPDNPISRDDHPQVVSMAGFVGGMLIRLAGTIALFLASSYHLTGDRTWIAGWVLFWHVSLLLVEVLVIARSTTHLHSS